MTLQEITDLVVDETANQLPRDDARAAAIDPTLIIAIIREIIAAIRECRDGRPPMPDADQMAELIRNPATADRQQLWTLAWATAVKRVKRGRRPNGKRERTRDWRRRRYDFAATSWRALIAKGRNCTAEQCEQSARYFVEG